MFVFLFVFSGVDVFMLYYVIFGSGVEYGGMVVILVVIGLEFFDVII